MTDSPFREVDDLRVRLNTLLDRAEMGDDARELASEALEELAVVIEELQAQNAELIANREALDDEQRRYRDLFETVPDGYLITDSEGIIQESNAAACALFGVPRRRVVGKPLATFIEASDRGPFYAQLLRIGDADVGGHLAINLEIRDHGAVPVNLRATHAESRADGRSNVKWLMRDRRHDMVTEALRESEERLRATFETAMVGVMLCNTDGDVLFSNRYADEVLDRTRGLTSSSSWLRTTHPDDLAAVETVLNAVTSTGESGSLRHRLIHADGSLRWVDHSVEPFRDIDGLLVGFVSTLIDVTTEQEAMARLADSRSFTAALLDTVGALVVVVDPEGRIMRFNKTCESMSGFSADEVIGRSLVDTLIPVEQRAKVADVIAELLTSKSNSFENDWITNDGRRRTISWTNTNLTDPDGSVTAIIGTGIDVTDAQLVESRLAQSDRLAAIGRLTSGIAHDFNNTLTTLRLRIDRAAERSSDESRGDLEAATSTVDRTQTLIGDLLAFSSNQRLAAARVDVNEETHRLSGVLSDLLGRAIGITLDLTDDDVTVLIDQTRFEQALMNLAINARDAMPDGGTLTITTGVETVEPHAAASVRVPGQLAPGTYVVISVADNGIGIDQGDLAHIFDPYFTTKPRGRGTGLGLATTYGTVKQSDGAILVDSEPGRGSTFSVWLPHADQERAAIAAAASPARAVADAIASVVLVVDDDLDIRRAIADDLNRLGFRTLTAVDGCSALDHIDTPIDVLVTDVQLPDINGTEVANRFDQEQPQISVVYISGASDSELRAELPAGAVVLRKPFSVDDLVAAIGRPAEHDRGHEG